MVCIFVHNVYVCLAYALVCVCVCPRCVVIWMAFFSTCHRAWKHLTIRGILEGWRDSTLTKWLLLLWSVTLLWYSWFTVLLTHDSVATRWIAASLILLVIPREPAGPVLHHFLWAPQKHRLFTAHWKHCQTGCPFTWTTLLLKEFNPKGLHRITPKCAVSKIKMKYHQWVPDVYKKCLS